MSAPCGDGLSVKLPTPRRHTYHGANIFTNSGPSASAASNSAMPFRRTTSPAVLTDLVPSVFWASLEFSGVTGSSSPEGKYFWMLSCIYWATSSCERSPLYVSNRSPLWYLQVVLSIGFSGSGLPLRNHSLQSNHRVIAYLLLPT